LAAALLREEGAVLLLASVLPALSVLLWVPLRFLLLPLLLLLLLPVKMAFAAAAASAWGRGLLLLLLLPERRFAAASAWDRGVCTPQLPTSRVMIKGRD